VIKHPSSNLINHHFQAIFETVTIEHEATSKKKDKKENILDALWAISLVQI
jgi:hypothetical protein